MGGTSDIYVIDLRSSNSAAVKKPREAQRPNLTPFIPAPAAASQLAPATGSMFQMFRAIIGLLPFSTFRNCKLTTCCYTCSVMYLVPLFNRKTQEIFDCRETIVHVLHALKTRFDSNAKIRKSESMHEK